MTAPNMSHQLPIGVLDWCEGVGRRSFPSFPRTSFKPKPTNANHQLENLTRSEVPNHPQLPTPQLPPPHLPTPFPHPPPPSPPSTPTPLPPHPPTPPWPSARTAGAAAARRSGPCPAGCPGGLFSVRPKDPKDPKADPKSGGLKGSYRRARRGKNKTRSSGVNIGFQGFLPGNSTGKPRIVGESPVLCHLQPGLSLAGTHSGRARASRHGEKNEDQ